MVEKKFDQMSESIKEKLKNCKDEKELQELLKAGGGTELNDEELDGVAGGIDMPELPDERIDCKGFFIV